MTTTAEATETVIAETVAADTTVTETAATNNAVLEQKIRKQIEFYFGDHNLPRDKFLQAELAKSPEGWIPLSILTSFNRLKSLSIDLTLIASSLKSSELVEVNEDGSCVRRRVPVSESKPTLETSLYVKGFGTEQTLEELEAYFESRGCEGIAAIRMRRMREDKSFKGSVFLEFPTEQAMQAAMEKLRSDDSMIVKTKSQYFNEKSSQNSHNNNKKDEEFEDVSKNYTRGCLLRVEGVTEDLSHHQVKQAFAALNAPVSYFEKVEGGNAAWIRFQESKAAEFASTHDSVEVKKENEGEEVVKLTNLRVATDEEEAEYYEKLSQILKEKSRNNQRGARRKGGNRNNHSKGNNRKRQLDSDNEDELKHAKVEADQDEE